jgi:preprotein translocase subunit SecB
MQESSNFNNGSDVKLTIDRLYVKEISCRLPHAPGLFETTEFKEAMGQIVPSIEISTKVQPMAANKYEVVLHAIVQGKAKNLSLFVLEVQQAGIFTVNVPVSQLRQVIESNCASYLHVYLSQAISNAMIQAGFPPIVLQPLQPIINQEVVQEQLSSQNKEPSVESVKHTQGILEKGMSKPN